ncbi:MAG: cellulose biosynthesis protein BcsD, partial [Novosphingobium sp.]|nr:cellulose biosynthesis protein BcsD [Novosphingobium sp.]
DAAAFLRLVGAHMAREMNLAAVETLEALEAAMNTQLTPRRWGWVKLTEVEAGIRIRHGGLPFHLSSAAGQAAAALLEGLYGHWLSHAGGGADLKARHTGAGTGEAIELVYGR